MPESALERGRGRRRRAGSRSRRASRLATERPVACWWPQPCGSATVPGMRSSSSRTGTRTVAVVGRDVGEVAVGEAGARGVVGVHVEVVGVASAGDELLVRCASTSCGCSRARLVISLSAAARRALAREVGVELRAPASSSAGGARWTRPSSVTTRWPRKSSARCVGPQHAVRLREQLAEAAVARGAQQQREQQLLRNGGLRAADGARECSRFADLERALRDARAEERHAAGAREIEVDRRLVALLAVRRHDRLASPAGTGATAGRASAGR